MPEQRFAKVALSKSGGAPLTYHFDEGDYAVGDRVVIPLKPRGGVEIEREGEIVAIEEEAPTFTTKAIIRKAETSDAPLSGGVA